MTFDTKIPFEGERHDEAKKIKTKVDKKLVTISSLGAPVKSPTFAFMYDVNIGDFGVICLSNL